MTNEEINMAGALVINKKLGEDGTLKFNTGSDLFWLNRDEIKKLVTYLEKVLENDK